MSAPARRGSLVAIGGGSPARFSPAAPQRRCCSCGASREAVRRDELLEVVAGLPPCLIGMEACSGAHAWALLSKGQELRMTV